MNKEKKDKHFIRKPEYIGGDKAMKQFVTDNLKYPEDAARNNIQGSVHLQYAIDHLGYTKNIKVISGIGYGCDEEAIRIVSGFKYKTYKKHNLQVEFHKNIHIHFKLNRPESGVKTGAVKPLPAETPGGTNDFQIVYHSPEPQKKPDDKPGSYEYSIPF